MNWVKNHVSIREDKIRSRQREFFAQKRLEKQAKTRQTSSGMSLDLLAVRRMNRDSPKKDGDQHQRVIKVDLDKFARCQRKVMNVDLGPMSPAKHVSSGGSDDRTSSFKGSKHSGQILSNARLTPLSGVKGLGRPSSGSSTMDFIPPLLPQPKSQHTTIQQSMTRSQLGPAPCRPYRFTSWNSKERELETPLIENPKSGQKVTFDCEAETWDFPHSISPATISSKQKSGDTDDCLLKRRPLTDLSPSRMRRGVAHKNLFMSEDFQDCFQQSRMEASRQRNDRTTSERSKDETEIFKGFMDYSNSSKKRNWLDEDGEYRFTSRLQPVSEDSLTVGRRQDFDEEERNFRVASKYARGTCDDLMEEKIINSDSIRLSKNDWKLASLESVPSGIQSGWKTSNETNHRKNDLVMPRVAGADGNKWLDHCNDSMKYFKERSSSVERSLTGALTSRGLEVTADKTGAADFLKMKKFNIISPKDNFVSQGQSLRLETGRSSSTSASSDVKHDEPLHYSRRQFHQEAARAFHLLQNSLSPDVQSGSWSAGSSDDERASYILSSSHVSSKCSNPPFETSSSDRHCGQSWNTRSKYFTEDGSKSSSNNWLKFAKGETHGPVVPACQNSQVPVSQNIDRNGVFHTEAIQVGSQSSSESVVNSRTRRSVEAEKSDTGISSQKDTLPSSSTVLNDANQHPEDRQKPCLGNQMAEEFVVRSFSSSGDGKTREFESTAEVELSSDEVNVENSYTKVESQADDKCTQISESRKPATKYKPFRELEICETSSDCIRKISYSTSYVQNCRSTTTTAETTDNGDLPLFSETSVQLPRTLTMDGFTQTSPARVHKVVDAGTSPVRETGMDGLLSPMREFSHLEMCDICRFKSATVDVELSPVFRRDHCDVMLSPVFQRSVADAGLSPVVFNHTVEAQLSPILFDFPDTLMNEVNQKTEIMNLPQELPQNALMLLSSDGKGMEVPEVSPSLQLFLSMRSMENLMIPDLRQLSESPSITLQAKSESNMCLDKDQPESTSRYTVEVPVTHHPDIPDGVVKVDHGNQQDLAPDADEEKSVDYNEASKNLASAALLTNDEILENGTLSHHVLVSLVSSDTKPCCSNIDFHAGFDEPEIAAKVVSTIEGMENGENLFLKPENHESLGNSSNSSVYSSPLQ